jgi:hypothetical protein
VTAAMKFRRIQNTAPGGRKAKIGQKPVGAGSTPTAKSVVWTLCVQHRDQRRGQVRVRETHPGGSFFTGVIPRKNRFLESLRVRERKAPVNVEAVYLVYRLVVVSIGVPHAAFFPGMHPRG